MALLFSKDSVLANMLKPKVPSVLQPKPSPLSPAPIKTVSRHTVTPVDTAGRPVDPKAYAASQAASNRVLSSMDFSTGTVKPQGMKMPNIAEAVRQIAPQVKAAANAQSAADKAAADRAAAQRAAEAKAAADRAAAEAKAKAEQEARLKKEESGILSSIKSLTTIEGNKTAKAQAEYDKAMAGFADMDAKDKAAFDKQMSTNETNLTTNRQKAQQHAAQGRQGLNAVLGSLGALGGTGSLLAARAVRDSANRDIGEAQDNFKTNAENLQTSWSKAKDEQEKRKADAGDTLANTKQQIKGETLTSRQSMLKSLADLFGKDTSKGMDYFSQASKLTPNIAATSKAQVTPYAKATSNFSPEALKSYLAGTSDLRVGTSGGSSVKNSPLFSFYQNRKSDRERL